MIDHPYENNFPENYHPITINLHVSHWGFLRELHKTYCHNTGEVQHDTIEKFARFLLEKHIYNLFHDFGRNCFLKEKI